MDYAAKNSILIITFLLVSMAIFLSFIRFIYWGWLLKKYDLSHIYPITAVFFPMIYLIAIINNDVDFSIEKTFAIILIIFGVIVVQKDNYAGNS